MSIYYPITPNFLKKATFYAGNQQKQAKKELQKQAQKTEEGYLR